MKFTKVFKKFTLNTSQILLTFIMNYGIISDKQIATIMLY
jgi:hypothetical protein